jgi:hypothetical protein
MRQRANLRKGAKGPMKMKYSFEPGGNPNKRYQADPSEPSRDGSNIQNQRRDFAPRAQAPKGPYTPPSLVPMDDNPSLRPPQNRPNLPVASPNKPASPSPSPSPKPAPTAPTSPKPAPKPNQGSSSFNQAFAAARKAGKTTFTYNGKSYGTRRADETSEQHKAAMARVTGQSSSAPKSAPAPERAASRPTPSNKPEAQLQRSTTPSVAPAAKSKPAARPAAQAPQSSSKTNDMKMKENIKKKMGGSYLEPDKELKFGGMKYEMGGMEECGPGRPCPNARKAAKTKRNQHKNLSRGQRRYMR